MGWKSGRQESVRRATEKRSCFQVSSQNRMIYVMKCNHNNQEKTFFSDLN